MNNYTESAVLNSYKKPTDRQILDMLGARIDRGEKLTAEEKRQASLAYARLLQEKKYAT